MKRIAFLVIMCISCVSAMAQRNVDFASKFMQECKGDTAIHCVTVGPKMMEQRTKHQDANRNENIAQAIQKLKTNMPVRFSNPDGPCTLEGIFFEVDSKSAKTVHIERFRK